MKTIALFYFSGTGNTELVARMLRDEFIRQEITVDLLRMEDVINRDIPLDLKKYDLIGIGSQVIGYGTPGIVHRFVGLLPDGSGEKVFIFRTAGGVAPINYNASKPIIRKLTRKGYDVIYERLFSIGSNWIARFNDDIVRQLHNATARKAALMVQELLRGERRILKTGVWQRLTAEIQMAVNPLFLRTFGLDYKVEKSCTQCGLCVKQCPVKNIYLKDNQVKFKLSCNGCLRCVYSCPKNAIRFRLFSFIPVAGGYNIQKILHPTTDWAQKTDGKVPPFFNRYIHEDNF